MLNPELLLNDITKFDKGKKARYHINGRGIPSVTELLSFIDSEGLIAWANRIGRQGQDNKEVADVVSSGARIRAATEQKRHNGSRSTVLCQRRGLQVPRRRVHTEP